jgi:protein-S-isoprenylcysteine O-methyltransferase Ste14
MFILARAITYSSLFIGFLLVFLPARILGPAGIARPAALSVEQWAGLIIVAGGAVLAAWCILTFVFVGRGTPAPFDPPRKLVVRGPYRFVRNPMYVGAILALAGAALFYRSLALLAYCIAFGLMTHLFVMLYEEPMLRRLFGGEYDDYCKRVHRWMPRRVGT